MDLAMVAYAIGCAFLAFCFLCIAILLLLRKVHRAHERISNLEALVTVSLGPFRPVHKSNGEWYFWDETWSKRLGPFHTEGKARIGLAKYVRALG